MTLKYRKLSSDGDALMPGAAIRRKTTLILQEAVQKLKLWMLKTTDCLTRQDAEVTRASHWIHIMSSCCCMHWLNLEDTRNEVRCTHLVPV